MKQILVVGLAVVLATVGSARADDTNGKGAQNSTPTSTTGTARSSGNGSSQQGTVARSNGTTGAPVAHHYPGNVAPNVNVQNAMRGNGPTNAGATLRVRREFLDRSEILARQGAYLNRNQVSPTTVQGTQNVVSTGRVRGGGQAWVGGSDQSDTRTRHHRGQDDSQNATNGTQTTDGTQPKNGQPIPATNTRLRGGNRVLSFNNSNTMSFTDACRRHHHDHHDRDWWRNHCTTIILIGGGFYAWDLGYWYPAYGYDPYYSNYAYDGPIYGYDGLPPDQIIANVQYALQQLGYFSEAVDGVLGPITRDAIAEYQMDNGLQVTGAIDRPTLVALGFIY